ncbi:MAG: glycosyltransferase family 4 protein [Terriglobia bacterium]
MEKVVAIDARMLGFSGIGTYLKNLLENYARMEREFSFRLACPRQESVGEFGSDRFTWVRADAPIYSLREQWQIPRAAQGADLLHCPHYNVPCFYRGRLLVTIHDLTHIMDRTFRRTLPSLVYARPMLAIASRKANHIITDSEFTKRQVVERLRVPPEKVTVIYLGVSPQFRVCNHEEAFHAASSALQLGCPYLLYIGTLKPHKNIPTLIRAFALLRGRKKVEQQLLIVGDDPRWKEGLVRLCSQLGIAGHVSFFPRVAHAILPQVYTGADLMVTPSFIEGFGLPVLEAMACGTPVVCSRAASLPEVAGEAAEYFEPASAEDLATAIERVLDSEERQSELRQKGLERAKHFSWYECARRTLDLYRQVL